MLHLGAVGHIRTKAIAEKLLEPGQANHGAERVEVALWSVVPLKLLLGHRVQPLLDLLPGADVTEPGPDLTLMQLLVVDVGLFVDQGDVGGVA